MSIAPIEDSQRKAARVVGLTYPITFATVVYVNLGVHAHLIVANDAAATARNILAHESLFRMGIVGDLVYCAGTIAFLTALYVVLEPIGRGLTLLATLLRLAWVVTWLGVSMKAFDALRLLGGADYLRAFTPEQLHALARAALSTSFDYYYVGLLFGALASTVCGYLWFKSRYIPRWLAAFGVIASAWCVACTLVYYVVPTFDQVVNLWWFDTPMAIFDLVTSVWLLARGLP